MRHQVRRSSTSAPHDRQARPQLRYGLQVGRGGGAVGGGEVVQAGQDLGGLVHLHPAQARGAAVVSEEALNLLGVVEDPVAGDREVLVLLLAEVGQVQGDGHAGARDVGGVAAATVV